MSDQINKIKKILHDHDYVVKVKKTKANACEVLYPPKKLTKPPIPITGTIYELVRNPITNVNSDGIYVKHGLEGETDFWSAPSYASRLMIMCDLLRKCRRLGFSDQLIDYEDEKGEALSGLGAIFEDSKDDEVRQHESFLSGILAHAAEDGFGDTYDKVAEDHGVYTGYRLLKSFF